MKKLSILLSCALALAATHATAQTYLECDFNEGIPSNFTLIDNDGLSPSVSMERLGFAVGTPWIAATPKDAPDMAAASTSWYASAGQSDDWMITPAVTIADDGAILRWRAMASDKTHRDGYAVYISESAGTTVADFDTSAPLFTVAEEEAGWTVHSVPLDAYKGKTVTIAFVNNSTDKNMLYIDDIYLGVYTPITMRLDLGRKIPSMGDIDVSGTVTNESGEVINGFTIGLEYSGETYTEHFDASVEPGGNVEFTFDKTLPVGSHETLPYTAWVESAGKRYTIETDVTSYPRRVVAEEGTGTWCGWCIRGLVMLEKLKTEYSDWAVGIAAHSGDVMESDYTAAIGPYIGSSYPTMGVNRKYVIDPADFYNVGQRAFNEEEVLVAMKAEAVFDETTRTVQTTTNLWFGEDEDDADYRLCYAIIENNVHQPDDPEYMQNNAYSGGASGPMGGYENEDAYVPASKMWYQEVARGYVDDIMGVPGSVPAAITADEEIEFSNSFTLPDNILDDDNVALVIMLVDQRDERIVNGLLVGVGKNSLTGINGIEMETGCGQTEMFTIDGRKVDSDSNIPGVYIMRTVKDGKAEVKKVLLK